jgi:hypothetical protein
MTLKKINGRNTRAREPKVLSGENATIYMLSILASIENDKLSLGSMKPIILKTVL